MEQVVCYEKIQKQTVVGGIEAGDQKTKKEGNNKIWN